jgi:dihydrofolate reductase
MSKVKVNISISLDGFAAGPNQSEQDPLGIGGRQLHQWLYNLAAFYEAHGEEGGEVNASTPVFEEWFWTVGATVMGRNMFGGGSGPWAQPAWNGWWGDDPPFHHSVFVVTHHAREQLELGGTTFHFITDGIETALARARAAAGEKDISIGGGANLIQQYLAAGLVDELELSVAPVLLGRGKRLFENLDGIPLDFEPLRTVEAPGITHLKYRLKHGAS